MHRLTLIIPALVLVACGDDATSPENVRPVSAFTYSCDELTCTFADQSTDQEGPIISSIFDFVHRDPGGPGPGWREGRKRADDWNQQQTGCDDPDPRAG